MLVNTFSSKQVTLGDGKRHYEIAEHDGSFSKHLKSVTTIIGYHKDMTALFKWRDKVGHEKAAQITQQAASTGTKGHNHIENYLKHGTVPIDDGSLHYACFSRVEKKLLPLIQPIAIEHPTYYYRDDLGGFAGSVDLVTRIDGSRLTVRDTSETVGDGVVPALCDWKLWTQLKDDGKSYKTKEPVVRPYNGEPFYPLMQYCVQLAAYSAALNQRTGNSYPFNKAFIVGITPTCRQPFVYYLNPEALCFYWEWMKRMVVGYAHQEKIAWKQMESEADNGGYLPLRCDIK